MCIERQAEVFGFGVCLQAAREASSWSVLMGCNTLAPELKDSEEGVVPCKDTIKIHLPDLLIGEFRRGN